MRNRAVDSYFGKIEEWVDRSNADIRADIVHRKLQAMDYEGSERTTRRAVAPPRPRPPSSTVTGASIGPGLSSPVGGSNGTGESVR